MRLTKRTKPKNLTLSQIWKLYTSHGNDKSPEMVIDLIDTYYTKIDRYKRSDKSLMFGAAKENYTLFVELVRNMTNGNK